MGAAKQAQARFGVLTCGVTWLTWVTSYFCAHTALGFSTPPLGILWGSCASEAHAANREGEEAH